MSNGSPFVPGHVDRQGTLCVAIAPARALELFTPRGEELWVPGWQPVYLHPHDGSTRDGGVFTTVTDGNPTYWMVTHWEPEHGRARYARITPELHAVDVAIECRANGTGTLVGVRYRLTALTERGNEAVAGWTEQEFTRMLRTWEELIANHLAS